jgi:hypothetical protein
MIRHIVMWRLRAANPEEKRAACELVKRSFESLRGRIPGMMHLEIGIDRSHVDYACDVVLMSEFESVAALEAYGTHPEHLRVRNELQGLRTARHQVDYAAGDGS